MQKLIPAQLRHALIGDVLGGSINTEFLNFATEAEKRGKGEQLHLMFILSGNWVITDEEDQTVKSPLRSH